MDWIPVIIYIFLLLVVLSYGGLIVYHVLRYKSELYDGQTPRVIAAMWFYLVIGSSVLLLSFILASLGPIILPQ